MQAQTEDLRLFLEVLETFCEDPRELVEVLLLFQLYSALSCFACQYWNSGWPAMKGSMLWKMCVHSCQELHANQHSLLSF